MYLSTSSSDRDRNAAPGERQPLRAGLRVRPSADQPTGVFVVVEMVVLVLVAALAMVSIIVASGGTDEEVHAADATPRPRLQAPADGRTRLFAVPSSQGSTQPNASAAPR